MSSVTTQYVYGPNGLLAGEYSSTGVMQREYIYLNDAPLAQATAGSPETVAYLHTDHLGTPRFATNAAGTSVWSWTNDAFGVSAASGVTTVNLRMPGQYYDAESGLFYNWNRYYSPAIGRYISSDPIGLAGGLNTFSYVGQNPITDDDIHGLAAGRFTKQCGKCTLIYDSDQIKGAHTHWQCPGKPQGCIKKNGELCDGSESPPPEIRKCLEENGRVPKECKPEEVPAPDTAPTTPYVPVPLEPIPEFPPLPPVKIPPIRIPILPLRVPLFPL